MVNTAREPRAYELMTILVPELAEEDLANQIQRISAHINTATGAIKETLTDSPWGRRRLAYSVRHNSQDYRDGYYIVFHFDLQPSRMTEIERELKLDVNVMRYLLVHDDPKAGEKDTSRPESDDSAVDSAAPSADGESRSAPPAPGSEGSSADAPASVAEAPSAAEAMPEAVPAVADSGVEEANAEPAAGQTESLTPASSAAAPATHDEPDAFEPVTDTAATGSSDPVEVPASSGDAVEDAADETDTTDDAKQEG